MMTPQRIRFLAGKVLAHGELMLQLLQVEWRLEKRRMLFMVMACAGFLLLTLATLLFVEGALILLLWRSPEPGPWIIGLIAVHLALLWWVGQTLVRVVQRPQGAYSALKKELQADVSLIKQALQ